MSNYITTKVNNKWNYIFSRWQLVLIIVCICYILQAQQIECIATHFFCGINCYKWLCAVNNFFRHIFILYYCGHPQTMGSFAVDWLIVALVASWQSAAVNLHKRWAVVSFLSNESQSLFGKNTFFPGNCWKTIVTNSERLSQRNSHAAQFCRSWM